MAGRSFRLLGVSRSSNRREVRRAYAQLIRVYKPEHFPEHFRRIRDAYELLDQRLAWMESNLAGGGGDSAPLLKTPPARRPTPRTRPAARRRPMRRRRRSALPRGDRQDLWQKARQGDLAGAYAHGSQLALHGQGDEELFVRLFWMLQVDGGNRSRPAMPATGSWPA